MPFSVSNIGLPPFKHEYMFESVKQIGFQGIEIAPSRIWQDTWQGLKSADVDAYRRQIENVGLDVVGLHSLFFDHPKKSFF